MYCCRFSDVRLSLRQLGKSRGFAIVAVLILAVGILLELFTSLREGLTSNQLNFLSTIAPEDIRSMVEAPKLQRHGEAARHQGQRPMGPDMVQPRRVVNAPQAYPRDSQTLLPQTVNENATLHQSDKRIQFPSQRPRETFMT